MIAVAGISVNAHLGGAPVEHHVFTETHTFVSVVVGEPDSKVTLFARDTADLDRLSAVLDAARADLVKALSKAAA